MHLHSHWLVGIFSELGCFAVLFWHGWVWFISSEPRLRLCAWSVVATRRVAPFDVQATLGGPLPGYEQTVPRVEAHAIKMLFQYTTAAVELCSDSQLCVRRLGKVRKQTYETLEHLNNLSVGCR